MNIVENKELSERDVLEIIAEIREGNTGSFELLYEAYYKMVISIIRRIVKPFPSELDGIVNEAFLLIFKGLKGFKGDSKFSTYAYRIVLNYAFKVSKKRSRDKKYFVIYGDNNEEFENISSTEKTEDNIIIKNSLEQAIGSLNKDLQEAIDLYYYQRYSVKEIATIVGTTETAIKNRLYQARIKIKSILEG